MEQKKKKTHTQRSQCYGNLSQSYIVLAVHSFKDSFCFELTVVMWWFISDLACWIKFLWRKWTAKHFCKKPRSARKWAPPPNTELCSRSQKPWFPDKKLCRRFICSVFSIQVCVCVVSRCAFLSVQVSDLTVTKDALINILREARQAIRCDSLFVSAHLRHRRITAVHLYHNKNNCTPFIPLLRFPLSAK